MQVRKFEAKTIKDAIELVKFHMGPDAIILSAKDNTKNFGLMGEASVEVTAAVSENRLHKKKLAESKLDSHSKQKYMASTARQQKEFIDKSYAKNEQPQVFIDGDEGIASTAQQGGGATVSSTPLPRRPTSARYIDIGEDGEATPEIAAQARARTPNTSAAPATVAEMAAVMKANEMNVDKMQISYLQKEIMGLRGLIEKFQSVPQNFMTLHPGADEGLPYELNFIFKRLRDAGVSPEAVSEMLKIANEVIPHDQKKKRALIDGWAVKYILEHVQTVDKPFKTKYHVFVGPTGQGKTSTVIKMACHLMMKERKKVALLSGDVIKVGAADQLKIYAQILNVPCAAVTKPQDWLHFEKALPNVDHVLFDTPGVTLKNPHDFDILRNILPPYMKDMTVHYVQSVLARDADACEIAERFKVIGFNDVIITRLDEALQYGLIYNFQKQMNVPLHSFGIGNNIPEDYELATKERVVDLIFALSKIKKERG